MYIMYVYIYIYIQREREIYTHTYVFVVGFLCFNMLCQNFAGVSSEIHRKFTRIHRSFTTNENKQQRQSLANITKTN